VSETDLRPIVIVPTYNEAENIRLLVADILAAGAGELPGIRQGLRPIPTDLVIVDDNSPDGTGEIAGELSTLHSSVHVIHRGGKLGLGTAYIAGFRFALAHDYTRIVTMDADFSHHPRFIPTMLDESRERADLVIGSRYVRGGGTLGCTLPRKALSWGANAFAKTVLGLEAMDCTAGFRCYRREVLESIDLDAIVANGYSFLIEMLYRCQRQGWQVAEIPILFENRRRGASKISRQEIIKAMGTVLRLGRERLRSPGRRNS
jgi:glycosyltransferase involved in cell wall biosynthesis